MKKIALFVTALAVSLSLGGRALADTNVATLADKAGITPDNTILYPIDKALDNLKINISFGDNTKIEVLVDIAEERLGESEVMADKEKADLSTQTLTEYNDKITEAQDKIEDEIDKVSDSTTTDSAVKLDELSKLETTLADRQMKSIEVLKNVENKVSGNAKETLALVIEMQTRKKEAIVAVIKEKQALLQNKEAVKEAEKDLEQAKKAGDEQAVKTAEGTLKQAQQALTTQNEKFDQVVAAKKEAMKGGVGQLKKEANKNQKGQTPEAEGSKTNTPSEDATATTGTASAETDETTTTTNTDTNTVNTTTEESTDNKNTTVKNNAKTDITVKENKGQEMKANKENHSKENNSSKENNPKH